MKHRRRRREPPAPLRLEPTWGQDYVYPCPFCDFTSTGQATLEVALHVHRTHRGRLQLWKLAGRDWTVRNARPVVPPTIRGGRVESALLYNGATGEAIGTIGPAQP